VVRSVSSRTFVPIKQVKSVLQSYLVCCTSFVADRLVEKLLRCQYLYLCTSNAGKLRDCSGSTR
jgi:hypothetical protein